MVVKRNQPLFRVKQNFKKSDGFLKMDIFKNVQNRKVKESFEKDVKILSCDVNALKNIPISLKRVTIIFEKILWCKRCSKNIEQKTPILHHQL